MVKSAIFYQGEIAYTRQRPTGTLVEWNLVSRLAQVIMKSVARDNCLQLSSWMAEGRQSCPAEEGKNDHIFAQHYLNQF